MGWLIALAVLIGFWFFPICVSARYGEGGPFAFLWIGPVRLQVFPRKKKSKQQGKKQKKAKKTNTESQKGGSVTEFLPIIRTILELLDELRRKIRVQKLELKCILADDDPSDLAIHYGQAWASLGNLMPHLERFLRIKKRDVEVECDFTAEQTKVYAKIVLTITLGKLLRHVLHHGVKVLKQYLNIMKLRKGGANNESETP